MHADALAIFDFRQVSCQCFYNCFSAAMFRCIREIITELCSVEFSIWLKDARLSLSYIVLFLIMSDQNNSVFINQAEEANVSVLVIDSILQEFINDKCRSSRCTFADILRNSLLIRRPEFFSGVMVDHEIMSLPSYWFPDGRCHRRFHDKRFRPEPIFQRLHDGKEVISCFYI